MFTKELHNFGILAQILWANLLLYFVYSSSDLILKKIAISALLKEQTINFCNSLQFAYMG